jgi:hypothetical protein
MAGPSNPDTILFDAPAKFTDGTSIPVGTISKYQYGFGQTSKVYTLIKDDTDMTPDSQGKQQAPLTIAGQLAFGQWFGAARAVTKDGTTSAWSNEAAFTVDAKTPEAPTGFTVA